MKTVYMTSAALAALIAAPALAGGYEVVEPAPVIVAPAPAVNAFNGGYVYGGVTFNSNNYDIYGEGEFDMDGSDGGPYPVDFNLPDFGGEGVGFTVGVGYDFALGSSAVVGLFGDYSALNTENDGALDFDLGFADFEGDYTLTQTSAWTIGARAGFTPSATTLIYGLVGYTKGEFEGDLNSDFGDLDYDFDNDGLSIGVGMETMVSENLSMKLEYRYTAYDEYELIDFADDDNEFTMDMDHSTHQVGLTVGYRF